MKRVWLSGVRNPTHLLYAASWLRTYGPCQIGLIDAGGFLARGLVTTKDVDQWLGHLPQVHIDYAATPTTDGDPATYLAIGVPGIKPWLAIRRRRPLTALPVVVVDEGLGSYGSWRTQRAALRRQGVREPRAALTVTARAGARALTTTRWAMYEREGNSWVLNEACASEFRRVQPDPAASNTIIYLSQPWPELGTTTAVEYQRHLCGIATAVTDRGWDFRIKRHPSQDPVVFAGLPVHPSDAPAELDPFVVGAHAVLGTQSTALLNLASVHRQRALRVRFPALDRLEADLGPRQAALLATFLLPPIDIPELVDALD